MVYNELGKTGMKVSNLGFGASSLGGVFRSIREDEGIRAVFTAVENGINFIDVSPYYGHLKAETVLGKALKDIPRDKYYLSTKVGRYGKDGVNTWDYSARRATESVYESMERLHVDYIDLINVHDIEFQAGMEGGLQKVVDETLPALVELRRKGVVGHVGITDLQPENLKWVVEHSEPGTVESILNFCHYSLNSSTSISSRTTALASSMRRPCRWDSSRSVARPTGTLLPKSLRMLALAPWNTADRKAIPLKNWPYSSPQV